jgi:hypothetical protein
MEPSATMLLGELCRRLDIPYRDARYVLEQGLLPAGVDPEPDRGNHRRLTHAQAFWLGIVLKLKQSGIKTPLAAKIADFAGRAVKGVSMNAAWDSGFSPFDGRLETKFRWFIDVGDLAYARVVTDSKPAHLGLYEFPWSYVDRGATADGFEPTITIRVDIGRIARLLRG